MKWKQVHGNYFFRFPRDDFWIRTIVKDYEFAKFISGKTDFKTVELNLLFDNDRPFSMHKKIEGIPLAEVMDDLSLDEVQNISKEISKFMYQVHNLKFNPDNIFKTKNIGLKLTDFLDELLNVHVDKKDMEFWDYNKFIEKDHNCLVHGDLNSSNILIDDNNHISAIIDFGFGGFGNPYSDIGRIIGRCPEKYKNEIIKSYEEFSDKPLNYQDLDKEIDTWSRIDKAYINYMTKIGIYDPNV